MATVIEELEKQVKENPVLLYMKGSADSPQCGLSSKASQILIACGKPFSFVDILTNPEIRANLPHLYIQLSHHFRLHNRYFHRTCKNL